jgi:hypothetical protein
MKKQTLPKSPKIFWDKNYAYHTDRLIEWCNDNPAKRAKLFSDLIQDAKEEGCNKAQLTTARKTLYQELAQYIFKVEPEFVTELKDKPSVFASATQCRLST